MPANLNPQAVDLLSWHGHASGGVHVPFQARPNPIGRVIDTMLVRRLRTLAEGIAGDATSQPRWIFLVGGPGNGKSETVQDFLSELDSRLGLNGALVEALRSQFTQPGLLPRKVEIDATSLQGGSEAFASKVGRLIVVQDATATESAAGNAAKELADDLADLFTCPPGPPLPVFVACANRGLLARCMNEAVRSFGENNEVSRLLASVIQAASLGLETLAGRKPCWPLEPDHRFACWPLDVESLLAGDADYAPLWQVIREAVDANRWETPGACQDCDSRDLCPFRQNAEWLRDDTTRENLLKLLRRGEIARGKRWNFRDAFSLVAELLVGQWSDFEPAAHPCEWVHANRARASANPPDPTGVLALAAQLYPNSMFRAGYTKQAAGAYLQQLDRRSSTAQVPPITKSVVDGVAAIGALASAKPIREMLAHDYRRLDPANYTPVDPTHPLRAIEDAFCQSVAQGYAKAQPSLPSAIEALLFDLLGKAEEEWNLLGRESALANSSVCLLRKLAAIFAKRSVGVRSCYHALAEHLTDYEASLRDPARLATIRAALKPLLGDTGPRFNMLEILGQPTAESTPLVSLHAPVQGMRVLPAPVATDSTPGHDVPCIAFTQPAYHVPLTFDFYLALQLRKEGCAGGSLPANVRAALDRIRHRSSGELCRDDDKFVDGQASIVLETGHQLVLSTPGGVPTLAQE